MKYQRYINAVVALARAQGCRVCIYNDRDFFSDGCCGSFHPSGQISIAGNTSCRRELLFVIIHELQHYYQFLKNPRPFYRHDLRSTLLCEYEAEKMVVEFTEDHFPGVLDRDNYIRGANAYMMALKWHYEHDRRLWIRYPQKVKSIALPDRWLSRRELLAPLSDVNRRALDRYWNRYGVKKNG